MNARSILGFAAVPRFASSRSGLPSDCPEPGVLELLAIGAVAGVVVAIRKRRKK